MNPVHFSPIDFFSESILQLYHYIREPSGEVRKISQVFESTNLRNAYGQYPIFKSHKPLKNGHQYLFRLPSGLSLKEILERKPYLETFLDSRIEIYPPFSTPPLIIIQSHKLEFPSTIDYEFNPPEMLAPLPIGMTNNGEILYFDASELPNILVGGIPGYGKTSLLKSWLVSLIFSNCKVCVIDKKRMDFKPLEKFINVAEFEDDSYSLVMRLLEENTFRQSLVIKYGVYKYQDFPSEIKDQYPYLVLIVDEAAEIHSKFIYEGIDSLCRLGRASGISVILATQKPSAALWDKTFSNTRDMCAGRLSYYVPDYMMSQVILGKGNTNACRLPKIKGRALSCLNDQEQIVQTMYLEPNKAIETLRELKSEPYFKDIKHLDLPKSKMGRPHKKKEE